MKKNNSNKSTRNSISNNKRISNKNVSNKKNVGFVSNNSRSFEYDPDSEHSFDLRDCR